MPNYIKNRLTIEGDEVRIKEMLEKFSTSYEKTPNRAYSGDLIYKTNEEGFDYKVGWLNEETGVFSQRREEDLMEVPEEFELDYEEAWTRFPDFNKVLKRPESLDIESGGNGDMGYSIIKGKSSNMFMTMEDMLSRFYDRTEEERASILGLGLKYYNNEKEHGYKNWYDWSINNWGTKWNSSSCEKISENVFEFTTAWSGVPNLINAIGVEYKDLEFIYEWSDENTGSNCGRFLISHGKMTGGLLDDQSKEAYEMAFKLDPDCKQYYKLIDGAYEYIEEEE